MLIAAPMANEGSHATAQDKKDSRLVIVENPAVHDPVMAYEGGKYYLFCTGHGITQMTSTDLKRWTISKEEC